MKVVINTCAGGFGLSERAASLFANMKDMPGYPFNWDLISRHDKCLIDVVEYLGEEANADYAKLKIIEIDGDTYTIINNMGVESVYTPENIIENLKWVKVHGVENEISK